MQGFLLRRDRGRPLQRSPERCPASRTRAGAHLKSAADDIQSLPDAEQAEAPILSDTNPHALRVESDAVVFDTDLDLLLPPTNRHDRPGGICMFDHVHQKLLAREDRNPQTNELEAPRMIVLPAYSGKRIDDGVTHVNDLLDWKESEPYCPILNEPRLYVAAHCRQAIWMFENYTGRGGEEGGCKDVADLARYIAQDEDLRYIEPGGRLVTGGFKDVY